MTAMLLPATPMSIYRTVVSVLTTPLTTSTSLRNHDAYSSSHQQTYLPSFQHEALVAALAISFMRYTVPCTASESRLIRLIFGIGLGYMTLRGYDYTTICVWELWSYVIMVVVEYGLPLCRKLVLGRAFMAPIAIGTRKGSRSSRSTRSGTILSRLDYTSTDMILLPPLLILSYVLSHSIVTSFASGSAQRILRALTPQTVHDLCNHLFPIAELYRSYDLVSEFVDIDVLNSRIYYLLFVTFHVQVGMGYLGIGFLREEQRRRNQLVRMEIIERDAEEEEEQQEQQQQQKATDDAEGHDEEEHDEEHYENGMEEVNGDTNIARRTRSARRAAVSNGGGRRSGTPSSTRRKSSSSSYQSRSRSRSRSKSATRSTTAAAARRSAAAARDAEKSTTSSSSSAATSRVRQKQLSAATQFRRSAAPFIFFTVLPYMFQIIFYGNMNMFAFHCVRDDVHRSLRVQGAFGHDAHLVAMAENSAMGPGAYAVALDTVVTTTYDIFNRKLFSLPKLMLLPGVVMRQPMLLVQIFPFVFATDFIKARLVAHVTTTVERLDKDAKEIKAIRSKVEAFDMKNAELLQRAGSGATEFTMKRWEELTVNHQNKQIASELLKRSRTFFQWLQRNFIFVALIDCGLAQLIAVGRIVSAEIFVFSRAIEDTVDLLLMRSRAESELATMMTEIDKLQELADVWDRSQERSLLPCHVAPSGGEDSATDQGIVVQNLLYSRGTALVRVDHMEIPPGIYAVTGANGSGKSTLFRVLMSCQTNEKPIDLPPSIVMETPKAEFIDSDLTPDDTCTVHDGCEVSNDTASRPGDDDNAVPAEVPMFSLQMPSSDVAEISQNFYWPLYTKPIDWIYQEHLSDCNKVEREERLNRVTDELMDLAFSQVVEDVDDMKAAADDGEDTLAVRAKLYADLQEEKEDWFGDLSGGQKSKVELVRKVFLHDTCPKVLLIDETMAPLDPASKSLVMGKLKAFCSESIVLVIYHTDVGRSVSGGGEDGEDPMEIECVPSNDFFHHNLHVENRLLTRRLVC